MSMRSAIFSIGGDSNLLLQCFAEAEMGKHFLRFYEKPEGLFHDHRVHDFMRQARGLRWEALSTKIFIYSVSYVFRWFQWL